MAKDLRFLPAIPEGMRIFMADMEVAGVQHRLANARAFAKGRDHELRLEREPNNRHDPNAIKVIGIYRGWFFTHSVHIGYVPAEEAKLIAQRGMFAQIQARRPPGPRPEGLCSGGGGECKKKLGPALPTLALGSLLFVAGLLLGLALGSLIANVLNSKPPDDDEDHGYFPPQS
jgi:hypothetical protein